MKKQVKTAKYVSVAELAKMLGISRIAVFKKIQKGQLPAEKVGRSYVITAAEADNLTNGGASSKTLTNDDKKEITRAVAKAVNEYGETLRLLGKE